MKKFIVFCAALLSLGLVSGCGSSTAPSEAPAHKTKVAVSFDAMKELVQAVGGDKVEITSIIPDGTEPHEFEPTPQQMKILHSTDVFVKQGLGMEPWAEAMEKAADNAKLTIVDASKDVQAIANTDEDEIKEHGQYDPHAWLSLSCAQIEVKNIAAGLAKADPANAAYYQKNAEAYNGKLQELLTEYQNKFKGISKKEFVTGHAAFAYLCRDFGLQQNSVESVFASGQPSAKQMAELVEFCRKHNVKTVFVEEMVSPKTSETLAKEVGANVKEIHTLESSEGSATYLDRMKENLQMIYDSLKA